MNGWVNLESEFRIDGMDYGLDLGFLYNGGESVMQISSFNKSW